jgi:glycosyltransferase involved in cell wall biosynthesis
MEAALAATADRYDAVLAMPYLWGTTYFAYSACPSKAVIIPCLHDEPYAQLSFVAEMLSGARGLLFNTEVEAKQAGGLVEALAPWGVVAVGFDPPSQAGRRRRRRIRLPDPSILYVGRREGGKNTPLLIDYFRRYNRRRPGAVALVFAGGGDPVPSDPEILEVQLDWRRGPHHLYEASTIVCQPSINESLSIVLLQGWLAARPGLVHGACDVTRMHCERSDGGLWFSSYAEFEEVLDRLLGSTVLREQLGRNGRAYVQRDYSWPAVLDRFDAAMERILGAPATVDARAGTR